MVKVERSLLRLHALRLIKLSVERVLGQRDDLALVTVVPVHDGLHDALADRGLKRIEVLP